MSFDDGSHSMFECVYSIFRLVSFTIISQLMRATFHIISFRSVYRAQNTQISHVLLSLLCRITLLKCGNNGSFMNRLNRHNARGYYYFNTHFTDHRLTHMTSMCISGCVVSVFVLSFHFINCYSELVFVLYVHFCWLFANKCWSVICKFDFNYWIVWSEWFPCTYEQWAFGWLCVCSGSYNWIGWWKAQRLKYYDYIGEKKKKVFLFVKKNNIVDGAWNMRTLSLIIWYDLVELASKRNISHRHISNDTAHKMIEIV